MTAHIARVKVRQAANCARKLQAKVHVENESRVTCYAYALELHSVMVKAWVRGESLDSPKYRISATNASVSMIKFDFLKAP